MTADWYQSINERPRRLAVVVLAFAFALAYGCAQAALSQEIVVAGKMLGEEETIKPYTLVRCHCDVVPEQPSEDDWLAWKVRNARDLTISADVEPSQDGFSIVFTGPPAAWVVETVGEIGGKHFWLDRVVVIGSPQPAPEPSPEPGPGPGPSPGPRPDFPDGRYGMAAFSYSAAMKVADEYRGRAKDMAEVFDLVANGIRGDGSGSRSYSSTAEAQQAAFEMIWDIVDGYESDAHQAWDAPFFAPWASKAEQDNPPFPDGVEALFRETSQGLGAVK